MNMYTITRYVAGRKRVARYTTLSEAQVVAAAIFAATGVVVGIEREGR